jgi:hypothetical protein
MLSNRDERNRSPSLPTSDLYLATVARISGHWTITLSLYALDSGKA